MKKIYRSLGILGFLLFLLAMLPANAQSFNVGGRVLDENGAPLPGVSVVEKGTTNGTATDVDGRFSLGVAGSEAVLVFSFIGYQSQEISVANRTNIDLSMQTDVTAAVLEEGESTFSQTIPCSEFSTADRR